MTGKARLPSRMASIYVAIMTLFVITGHIDVQAADVKGSKDHPMISRYEGSEITNYKQDAFNEYALVISKVPKNSSYQGQYEDSMTPLEGRVTWITYKNPEGRTTLEVFRNYEDALAGEGFEVLFECKNKECGGRDFSHIMTERAGSYIYIGESYNDMRYLAAKLSRDEGDVYVALFVGYYGKGVTYTQLQVIEVEAMQENMVVVDADAMAKGIGEEGRIALYGILFDYDSAKIRPESNPALEQIAALMNGNPDLDIVIVGHTDNQGGLEYNMSLSKRRAKAVEAVLVRDFKIPGKRLSAWGVGYLSPIASNRDEAGRAKNRRVELVEK
jgi:OOP family OmpA-OmpF porin